MWTIGERPGLSGERHRLRGTEDNGPEAFLSVDSGREPWRVIWGRLLHLPELHPVIHEMATRLAPIF